jgi:putative oxygen-independent coproporphyrinogen III oxidase
MTLALYIHWPFCVSKCPYCDFNSHVRDTVDMAAWQAALLADMAHEAKATGQRPLTSIFFGGGTPSLMPPQLVAQLIERAAALWGFAPDIEITLEANPSSVEAARFADLAAAGVNRVSLGLQSFHDDTLHLLGRAHDGAEGLAALDTAQRHFARVNFDLIYALPGQSATAWEDDLRRALALGTEHLSLYQLTIEPGTRFETLVRTGALTPKDADEAADFYELTNAVTTAAGLARYEVSNHARPGAESRHNMTYWRYGDYIGIGPGAHGRRQGVATVRHKKPENFLSAITRNGHGTQTAEDLSAQEQAREALLMGLRLSEGVDLEGLSTRTSLPASALVRMPVIDQLEQHKLIWQQGPRLGVTAAGMLLLDHILGEIVLA